MPRIRQRVWVKLKILRTPRINDPWQVLLKLPVCSAQDHWWTLANIYDCIKSLKGNESTEKKCETPRPKQLLGKSKHPKFYQSWSVPSSFLSSSASLTSLFSVMQRMKKCFTSPVKYNALYKLECCCFLTLQRTIFCRQSFDRLTKNEGLMGNGYDNNCLH